VKVQAANGPVLTTQLYFPGEAGNARDPLFRRELLMAVSDAVSGRAARFDFVIERA
jgi:protocatechuate 3,4-dioxygenase beta subunit